MKDWIKDTALSLWTDFVYFVTLQFVDPFWWLLLLGIVAIIGITAVMALISFYFGMPSWLRKLGGFIVFGIIFCLASFRSGENAARKHDAGKSKPSEPKDDTNWFKW